MEREEAVLPLKTLLLNEKTPCALLFVKFVHSFIIRYIPVHHIPVIFSERKTTLSGAFQATSAQSQNNKKTQYGDLLYCKNNGCTCCMCSTAVER